MPAILIKNIQLIDGTGQPAYKADVLIKEEKISAIGRLANCEAEEIIDGMNAYLAPGFIDISNASDKYLNIFHDQLQENLLTQGVATIIGGHNGISLAPLFYGTLNILNPFLNGKKININWHEFSEFAAAFSKIKLGVNFGSLAGCETIYSNIIKDKSPRSLEANEEKILYQAVEKSLSQGAFGASLNLDGANSKISYYEIKRIAEITRQAGKICSIGFDKNDEGMAEKVKKIIHISKETSSHFLINELTPITGYEGEFEQAIQIINSSQTACDARFNFAPCREIVRPIKDYLPSNMQAAESEPCQGREENIESQIENLKIKNKEILKHLKKIIKTGKITVVSAGNNKHLIGQTLREFSHHRDLSLIEGFFELMKITGLQAEISSPDANEETILKSIMNEKALIATGNNINSQCRPFKKFLETVQKENIMPLEKAINKITLFPSQLLNLKNRGAIKIGYFADLVIFKNGDIKEMMINGRRTIIGGKTQGISAGKFLKP